MFWNLKREPKIVEVTNLNDLYIKTASQVQEALTGVRRELRRKVNKKRCFVIDFNGDIMATQSKALNFEITSVICSAQEGDEVLIRLQSPGGAAHAYGYAASQLERLKKAGIRVTVAVDMVAASGGYMMACVADEIIAAPFAIIGSVGVVSEFPNFFSFMRNLGIDYKQYTAGKYKRTVSPLGEITDEGEEKFKEDLVEMYDLFRDHVSSHRENLDMDVIATGEHWQGIKALELGLVDKIETAEEYILDRLTSFEFAKITYVGDRKTLAEKIGASLVANVFGQFFSRINSFLTNYKYMM
jgi:serine protease SohB